MTQLTLPGVAASEVETIIRELADAGRLRSVSLQHRSAYNGGWRDGWFASVGYDYTPSDREGDHPCVVLGHDKNDPIAALVDALRKAKGHYK